MPEDTFDLTNRRKMLAQKLMMAGVDSTPVQSWTQGASRMAQALVGGMMDNQEREDDLAANKAAIDRQIGLSPGASPVPSAQPQGGADYFSMTRSQESGGNPNARSATSSATGPYQFTASTWDDLAKRNPQLGLTPDGRTDPAQNERAVRAFTDQNAGALKTANIEPTPANLRMSHFLGTQGGPSFITNMQQNPNAPAYQLVSPAAAQANQEVFFNKDGSPKTAQQVYDAQTASYRGLPGIQQDVAQLSQRMNNVQSQAMTPATRAAIYADLLNPRVNSAIKHLGLEMLKPKDATFGVIGQDADGNSQYGWIDPRTRSTTAAAPATNQQPAGPSALPPTPPGVNEKEWRLMATKNLANSVLPGSSEDAGKLRTEIRQLPSYKNYSQASPIYKSMMETADRDSKASDLNLVYGLGKIMDPGSVVREGEMVMVKNTASLPDWLQGAIAGVNGGAALTPETRKNIMAEAHSRMKAYEGEYTADTEHYRGIAGRSKLNVDDVIPPMAPIQPYKPPALPVPAAPALAGVSPAQPGTVGMAQPQQNPDGWATVAPGIRMREKR